MMMWTRAKGPPVQDEGYTQDDVRRLMRTVVFELNEVLTDQNARRRFALAMKRRLPGGVLDVEVEAEQPQTAPVPVEEVPQAAPVAADEPDDEWVTL